MKESKEREHHPSASKRKRSFENLHLLIYTLQIKVFFIFKRYILWFLCPFYKGLGVT